MNLVVFDIDGTLTESVTQHQLALVNAMKENGITEINQNWSEYKHHTDSYILKINYEKSFTENFDLKLINKFEDSMTEILKKIEPIKEIDGAKNFVDFLRTEKKYALTFATGSLLKPALLKLDQSKIWHNENLVVSSNQNYEREQVVKKAINRAKEFYKVEYFENIISIGDGIWDMKTARNLNLKFIGVGLKNYGEFVKYNIEVHTKNWENFNFENAENKLIKLSSIQNLPLGNFELHKNNNCLKPIHTILADTLLEQKKQLINSTNCIILLSLYYTMRK